MVGTTRSTDFPVVNARQSADGSALDYATYLGGADEDRGNGVAADAAGNAYVTGQTWSADFPIANPWQATYSGILGDAFAGKFTSTGAAVYVTYLGGNNGDRGNAIAVNPAGEAYVTGCGSNDFPLVNPLQSFPTIFGCAAFVARLSADGSALRYSTLLGGGEGFGITWGRGLAYVGGEAGPHFVSQRPLKPPTAGKPLWCKWVIWITCSCPW